MSADRSNDRSEPANAGHAQWCEAKQTGGVRRRLRRPGRVSDQGRPYDPAPMRTKLSLDPIVTKLILSSERVTPVPDDAYETDLIILLTDVARMVRTLADRRARAQGMTRAQWMILARLRRRPGMTQRELAEILEVEPITVGRLVDRLESRGLVERRADPADRRVWRLHLTSTADPVLAEIDEARHLFDAEATRGLTSGERGAAIAALLRMKANLQACAVGTACPGEATAVPATPVEAA